MENNNFWIIAIAVVAVVAIVAVFGMVSMTGYAVKVQDKTPQVCNLWEEKCMQVTQICDILVHCLEGTKWCDATCSCIPENQICGNKVNCQQCCALGFSCKIQRDGTFEKEKYVFNECMDRCDIGGGNAKCDTYTTCTTCNQYNADGCRWSNGVCSYCPSCATEACMIEVLR